jgi:hypothetical protein
MGINTYFAKIGINTYTGLSINTYKMFQKD